MLALISTRPETEMTRLSAADFDPEVLRLFDGYVHGRVSRRDFLARAGRYAAGGTTDRKSVV